MTGGLVAFLLGTWTPLLTALLVVQIFDIITGVLVGGKEHDVSSKSFFSGLKKKGGMWILIILANMLDTNFMAGLPVFKSAVSGFLIGGEGLSLIENLGLLGVPIPKGVKKFLAQLKEDNDKEDFEQKGDN